MTVTTEQPTDTAVAPVDAGAPVAGDRSRAGIFLTPAVLLVGLAFLYFYVRSQSLDSIERRFLNRKVLATATYEHIQLAALSTVLVILIAIPLGIMLTRPGMRRATPFVLAVVNVGQAVPSIGVIALLGLTLGYGFRYATIALVLYSFLPVLRNTMVGLQRVDRSLIDAGRGMGMTKRLVLSRVELPLAVPVMMAGIRTALIINVGTATLATYTDAGGLGDIIDQGLTQSRTTITITGAVLVGVLALTIDWLAGLAERFLRPRGL